MILDKLHKKTKLKIIQIVEWVIRLVFFFIWPALFSTAFTGVKNIVEMIGSRNMLTVNPFIITLLVLLIFTVIFGRYFCGFLCAFGTYGDLIYACSSFLRKKFGKKGRKRPFHAFSKIEGILKYGKYIVLCATLILIYQGYGSTVASHSPFSTFSRLHALKSPDSRIGIIIFIIITLGMAVEPRFFCRFLCPMGAVFSLMPVLPWATVKRNRDQCIPGCQACKRVCPAGIDIASRKQGDNDLTGECFTCGKCISTCPRNNIQTGLSGKYRVIFHIIKALIFAIAIIFIS